MQLKQLPPPQRPRERLLSKGAHALSDAELLALFLRTGYGGKNVVELAHELLAAHGSLQKIVGLSHSQLCRVKGIGPSKAVQFTAALELAKRLLKDETPQATLEAALESIQAETAFSEKEMLYAIYLDARGRVLKTERIATGTINASAFHPREVFKTAFAENAAGIALAHNHPSGNSEASEADVEMTRAVQALCDALGSEFQGHCVVTSASLSRIELPQNGVDIPA
ncbi:MAG: DNA repair protein RadC [Candidatus Micrarchaeota archaeon]|nr:DNA repair protein RadC [Candidatus Micrarchaeota archaeon]